MNSLKNWSGMLAIASVLCACIHPAMAQERSNALFPNISSSIPVATNSGSADIGDLEVISPGHSATNSAAVSLQGARHHKTAKKRHNLQNTTVVFGHDVEVKEGESVATVVAIGGSVVVRGTVTDEVVCILGDVSVSGGQARNVASVLGGVRAENGAQILGDAVSVGGELVVEPDASVHGDTVSFCPFGSTDFTWLRHWVTQCVFKLRPFAPQVGWTWFMAGLFLLLYLFIRACFPRPVQACLEELNCRPATTFALGILTTLLVPLVFGLLAVTVAGLAVVPFVLAALFIVSLVGKTALLEWFGRCFGPLLHKERFKHPLPALLLGGLLVSLLYEVPILGLLIFLVMVFWSLGCAVSAVFASLRRESPPEPIGGLGAASEPALASAGARVPEPGPFGAEPLYALSSRVCTGATVATAPQAPPVMPLPEAMVMPRAGFWLRMLAGALDVVFLEIAMHILGLRPLHLVIVAGVVYFTGMWAWKATTLGGILLKLKVSRLDGSRVTIPVALVRSLSAVFSGMVLFLGFFWIGWSREKQGWHDLIAGTVVLRVPRHTPLI